MTIAGALTLVALGAMTAVALQPKVTPLAPAPPVQVRTEVVHRTVWITRHAKQARVTHQRTTAAPAAPAAAPARATPAPAPVTTPVAVPVSARSPAPASATPATSTHAPASGTHTTTRVLAVSPAPHSGGTPRVSARRRSGGDGRDD